MTTEALDRMLSELAKSTRSGERTEGLKIKASKSVKSVKSLRSINQKEPTKVTPGVSSLPKAGIARFQDKGIPTSLNYAELSNFMASDPQQKPEDFANTDRSNCQSDVSQSDRTFMMNIRQKNPWSGATDCPQSEMEPRPAQNGSQQRMAHFHADDHSAIEIHQSKSYIVNLIDRALSREFKTLPEVRSNKNCNINVSQNKAGCKESDASFFLQQCTSCSSHHKFQLEGFLQTPAGVMNQVQSKFDNELCLEIKQALAEASKPHECVQACQVPGVPTSKESFTSKDSHVMAAPSSTGKQKER